MNNLFNISNGIIGTFVTMLLVLMLVIYTKIGWYVLFVPLLFLITFFVGYATNKIIEYIENH